MSKFFEYIVGKKRGKIAELEAREEYALGHLGNMIDENEKLRAQIKKMADCCNATEYGQLRCRCFKEFQSVEVNK